MSFSPLSLARLQEMKLWQGSFDNLLQKPRTECALSLDGISSRRSPNPNFENDTKQTIDWDKRKITPTKNFEQLLEQKLAEDTPVTVNPKPKKPFLRKGEGLARFRMNGTRPVINKRNRNESKKQVERPIPNTHQQKKGILKKNNHSYHQEIDLTPLTMPDFIKPRGTWKQVFENAQNREKAVEDQETLENYEEFRKSLGTEESRPVPEEDRLQILKTSSNKYVLETEPSDDIELADRSVSCPSFNSFNKNILDTVNEYAKRHFKGQTAFFSNRIPDAISELETPKINDELGELTLEELKNDRELEIFEALEEKVDHSSFCSTNTSVVNMLASTPRKVLSKNRVILEKAEEQDEFDDMAESFASTEKVKADIEMKLRQVTEKTDVLQKFLLNLKNMERDSHDTRPNENRERTISTNTSFSDENTRWSSRSPSLIDNYTDYDSTYCQSDRVNIGVNTSFESLNKLDETVKTSEPCKDCEELRAKYSECKLKLVDVTSENSKMKAELRELRKEYEKVKNSGKKQWEQYQEKLDHVTDELESERKKMAKERAYFASYVKEAQNRPSKREREEITQLKQELADTKEVLKLKDTKNGATQARLRTQIKQQEKELVELKSTVEKLQKENAKLSASQKYSRRPQEVKMLHEINKNLSKLAEETLKKQINKSSSGDLIEGKKADVSREDTCDKENEKLLKNTNDNKSPLGRSVIDNTRSDGNKFIDTPKEGLSIERQYETIFGHLSSPRNASVSTDLEKTEKILADGSVEIVYSNGNIKTVSADGKYVRMKYFNGDTKETDLKEQIMKYHYAAADSWHTQYPDGTEVMEFKDGQKCTKYPNGKTEVSYPDGSLRTINPDGTEEQQFPDGRKTIKNLQGETIILLPNGQREIHTPDYKRREYPDGTIRTLHKDGTVETVYGNGRVRLKDANGVLVMDTHQI